MEKTDRKNSLEDRLRLAQARESYYKRKSEVLENTCRILLKGAISTEYGAFVELADILLDKLSHGTSKEDMERAIMKLLRKYFGSYKEVGILAKEINRACFNLIDSLTGDFPDIGILEVNIFCCMIINMRDSLIRDIFELGTDAKTAHAKHDIIMRIKKMRSPRRLKYMKMLQKKDCNDGKNLLSLHDLSKFCHGKPEKNKD